MFTKSARNGSKRYNGQIYTKDELGIIRQTDNSSKYKFEDEFRSVIRLSTEFILETDYPSGTDNFSLV